MQTMCELGIGAYSSQTNADGTLIIFSAILRASHIGLRLGVIKSTLTLLVRLSFGYG